MSVGKGFLVLLFLNHSNDTVLETIITRKSLGVELSLIILHVIPFWRISAFSLQSIWKAPSNFQTYLLTRNVF